MGVKRGGRLGGGRRRLCDTWYRRYNHGLVAVLEAEKIARIDLKRFKLWNPIREGFGIGIARHVSATEIPLHRSPLVS